MGVVLSDEIRAGLEIAATRNGCSLGEEIRRRLHRTLLEDEIRASVKNLMSEVAILASLTRTQTGQDWRTHPGANAVLRHAISARLARTKNDGPETFAPSELPSKRLVAPGSDDPHTMGLSLEARLDGNLRREADRKGLDYPSDPDTEHALHELFWATVQLKMKSNNTNEKEEKNSDGT
jgi:hypothetical protein